MREVEDNLIAGVAVDGGHDAADDAACFQDDLDDGRQAVGGAAGVGDDIVLGCVVLVLVDAQHDSQVLVGGRSGDDDLLHGRAEVSLGLGCVSKVAGGLNDDLCADGSPVQLGGILLGEDLDLLAIDGDEIFAGGDFIFQVAQDRVVLEQVGQRRGAGQVVDGNKIDLLIAKRGAQNIAANAAEAIDSNFNCHLCVLLHSRCDCGLS